MVVVWRLVSIRHAIDPMSGEGARQNGGRWNEMGVPVIYTSEHRSLAALEVLVHLNGVYPAARYRFLSYDLEETMIHSFPALALPSDWREEPPPFSTMAWGTKWARETRAPALAVPSAVLPEEKNIIINPRHPEASRIKLGRPSDFVFDPRLFLSSK